MRDWFPLIDKRAARREQFPLLRAVQHERPGCAADRSRQEYWRAANRRSVAAESQTRQDRERADEADADRFIFEMKRREQERFLSRLNERKAG